MRYRLTALLLARRRASFEWLTQGAVGGQKDGIVKLGYERTMRIKELQ